MPPIDIEEFDRLVTSAERPGLGVYSRIMERLVAVTGAKAGAFWNCDDKPFTAIVHYSAGEAAKIGFSQSDHDRILAQVVQQQRSAVVKSKAIDSSEAPTLFFAPVKGHTRRVVELVFPGNHRIRSSREFLQELHRICEVFEKLQPLANAAMDSARPVAQEHISVEAFSRYVHALHSSMDGRLTAANIANESRQLLDCDRVSVVHWHRGRFRILAISGQVAVNRRSNTVQLLERLAAEVLKAKTELWYPTDEELVPQIKSVLDAYLVQATTRSLVIQPIAALALAQHEDTDESQRTSNVVIGGVIYEHNRELWSRAEQATTLNLTTQQSGNAFRNAKQHQELFLYPLWRWLGKSRLLTSPARLPTTLLVFAALVALSLFLAFWPVPFYISASGILVPQDRR
ncbi:MAG: hypothetical protein IT423_02295, partial [Pirellulaceae bacterium]|nr:hypothetical protein [Pirellulaceae bacterium]